MSEEKCFCHLNGYAVKDATARKDIETLQNDKCDASTLALVKNQLEQSIGNTDNRVTALQAIVDYNLRLENASEINYDNSNSNLTATNVNTAIDEVNEKVNNLGVPNANVIPFNGTGSGLVSINVQNAILEVANKLDKAGTMRFIVDPTDENFGLIQYKNGDEWVDYERLYIGDGLFVVENGVFDTKYNLTNVGNNPLAYEQQADGFKIYSTQTGSTGYYVMKPAIDFSKFSKLKITVSALGETTAQYPHRIGITSDSTKIEKLGEITYTNQIGVVELDLSEINSEAYLYFGVFQSVYITFSEIILM